MFLSGAGRAPLSEGGRDARGRRGEGRGGGSLREPGAAVTGRHGHHSPAAAGTPLTAGVSRITARRDAAAPPGQCREAAGPSLPGQGGASSHLEEPGEPLVGNFPLLREARPVPLAALPKAERGPPPLRRLRASGSWVGRAGTRRTGRGSPRGP